MFDWATHTIAGILTTGAIGSILGALAITGGKFIWHNLPPFVTKWFISFVDRYVQRLDQAITDGAHDAPIIVIVYHSLMTLLSALGGVTCVLLEYIVATTADHSLSTNVFAGFVGVLGIVTIFVGFRHYMLACLIYDYRVAGEGRLPPSLFIFGNGPRGKGEIPRAHGPETVAPGDAAPDSGSGRQD